MSAAAQSASQPVDRRARMQYLAARAFSYLPDAVKIRLSGEPPIVVDGQQLDPQLQALRIATRGRTLPGLIEPTVAAGRARFLQQTQAFRGPRRRSAPFAISTSTARTVRFARDTTRRCRP